MLEPNRTRKTTGEPLNRRSAAPSAHGRNFFSLPSLFCSSYKRSVGYSFKTLLRTRTPPPNQIGYTFLRRLHDLFNRIDLLVQSVRYYFARFIALIRGRSDGSTARQHAVHGELNKLPFALIPPRRVDIPPPSPNDKKRLRFPII